MNKKRLSKAVAALGMLALYTVSTLGAAFKDVPSAHWAYLSVSDMQKRGIMLTSSSGEFFPNKTMNYFEMADVLAKTTGYVDVNTTQKIDASFKKQIISNYEKQKPILTSYQNKYKSWDKLYNQQIAYLLGRGYLKQDELNQFISLDKNKKETKNIVTKQDFAIFVVRVLGKETTAKTTYKTSGFSDDNLIQEKDKPYIGFLKSMGIVTPDEKGNFNGKAQVTRAICAKTMSNALAYKENKTTTPSPVVTTPTVTTPTVPSSTAGNVVMIKKVVPKSDSEYYIQVESNGKTSFPILKKTTKVTDASGKEVATTNLPVNVNAVITTQKQNNSEYIISMKYQSQIADTPASFNTTVVNGTIARLGVNRDLSIQLSDDTTKTYLLDSNCTITRDNKDVLFEDLQEDDTVKATVVSNLVTKLEVLTGNSGTANLTDGEVTKKSVKASGYVLTVKQGSRTSELEISSKVDIKKNNKRAEWEDIRIGDKVKPVRENGIIEELIVTGTRENIEGDIVGLYIGTASEVTIQTKTGKETFTVNETTEIYDNNKREAVSLRDIRLGQAVEVLLESKEVVSLVIQKNTNSKNVSYKGEIQEIGRKSEYIDVVVDYDPITDSSRVVKRVKTPLEVEIEKDGKSEHRSSFKVGMQVVITFKYLDDDTPEKILILE